jgi:hypothetical protein
LTLQLGEFDSVNLLEDIVGQALLADVHKVLRVLANTDKHPVLTFRCRPLPAISVQEFWKPCPQSWKLDGIRMGESGDIPIMGEV